MQAQVLLDALKVVKLMTPFQKKKNDTWIPPAITRPSCAKKYEPTSEPKPKTAKKATQRPKVARKPKVKRVVKKKEKVQQEETDEGFRLVTVKAHYRTSKTGTRYLVKEHVRRIRTKAEPMKQAA